MVELDRNGRNYSNIISKKNQSLFIIKKEKTSFCPYWHKIYSGKNQTAKFHPKALTNNNST